MSDNSASPPQQQQTQQLPWRYPTHVSLKAIPQGVSIFPADLSINPQPPTVMPYMSNDFRTKLLEQEFTHIQLRLDEQEMDPHRLSQRMKQIAFGKNTPGYQIYAQSIPRGLRQFGQSNHPVTPRLNFKCPKRSWDNLVGQWRRALHLWDSNPNPPSMELKGVPTLAEMHLEETADVTSTSATSANAFNVVMTAEDEDEFVEDVDEGGIEGVENQEEDSTDVSPVSSGALITPTLSSYFQSTTPNNTEPGTECAKYSHLMTMTSSPSTVSKVMETPNSKNQRKTPVNGESPLSTALRYVTHTPYDKTPYASHAQQRNALTPNRFFSNCDGTPQPKPPLLPHASLNGSTAGRATSYGPDVSPSPCGVAGLRDETSRGSNCSTSLGSSVYGHGSATSVPLTVTPPNLLNHARALEFPEM